MRIPFIPGLLFTLRARTRAPPLPCLAASVPLHLPTIVKRVRENAPAVPSVCMFCHESNFRPSLSHAASFFFPTQARARRKLELDNGEKSGARRVGLGRALTTEDVSAPTELRAALLQVSQGVEHLHSLRIVHRYDTTRALGESFLYVTATISAYPSTLIFLYLLVYTDAYTLGGPSEMGAPGVEMTLGAVGPQISGFFLFFTYSFHPREVLARAICKQPILL